jgi:hypothetical protein
VSNDGRPKALKTSSYGTIAPRGDSALEVGFDIAFKGYFYIMSIITFPLWAPFWCLGKIVKLARGEG